MSDGRERFLIRYAGGFAPMTVERAEGAWVETTDGRRVAKVLVEREHPVDDESADEDDG